MANCFNYKITLKNNPPVLGSIVRPHGALHVVEELPEDEIVRVEGSLNVPMSAEGRLFMNGYQSWTYSTEHSRVGRTHGVAHLPKFIIDHYGLDRYGDYNWVSYPEKPGVTHGESYCYFREGADFRLIGSLDETPGYTLFRYDCASHELRVERDCAGLRCGGPFHAFDLYFAHGREENVFDAWFGALGVKARTQEKIAGYTSWYNRYENISAGSIREDLEGCVGNLRPGDLFQIDDGWEPNVGDWLEADPAKFPDGMKQAADMIHAAGFRAGLWLAPFAANKASSLYREHQDWFLKDEKGKPWRAGCNWGGFFGLDIDNPEVVDYLERVFHRVLDEWGYDLVKLDFLYAAAPFGTADETRAGRMIRAMKLLRRLCWDKLILGCGVPVMPAFGLVDYCRIGCDVGLDWDDLPHMRWAHRERVSTRQSINNTVFRRQLNGRAWLNDPDVFFLREDNLKLTDEQKYVLATVNSVLGGVLLHSDNMAKYGPVARAQYAQLLRNRDAVNIEVEKDLEHFSLSYELDGKRIQVKIE